MTWMDVGVTVDARTTGHPDWQQPQPAGFAQTTFNNPLYDGADPWVTYHGGYYYLIQATANGIEVSKSATLTRKGETHQVWCAPRRGWNPAQIWAPELHHIRGRWYIYYAASDGRNANHRMGVLESEGDDPTGPYVDRGMLYTGDHVQTGRNNRWAIDGTVLQLHNELYFIWSGWEDHRDIQHLYIAKMSDPCTIASNRVRLCHNCCHEWECVGETRLGRGLNEAPQVLVRNGRVCLIYSCSGSWEPSYKLGMLHMPAEADPMQPSNWTKVDQPVFQSSGNVFGVGHCCFTTSPDGSEDWIIYHAKKRRSHGWARDVRAQRFTWDINGMPVFGKPVDPRLPLRRPAGDELPISLRCHAPGLGGGSIPASLAASPDAA